MWLRYLILISFETKLLLSVIEVIVLNLLFYESRQIFTILTFYYFFCQKILIFCEIFPRHLTCGRKIHVFNFSFPICWVLFDTFIEHTVHVNYCNFTICFVIVLRLMTSYYLFFCMTCLVDSSVITTEACLFYYWNYLTQFLKCC